MPFMLLALLAMGLWVRLNRGADRWLLYGGLALMARFWAYHQLYDDMLNLIAFVALLRLATGTSRRGEADRVALLVLLVGMLTLPGPATPLRFDSRWMTPVMRGWQTAVRVLMLAVIMQRAARLSRRLDDPSAASLLAVGTAGG